MPYRDEVPRVSIAQLRAQFTPRAFRALTRARLEVGGVVGEVSLVDGDGQGFVQGTRRWFACPRCERRVNVLGAVDACGWVCLACGGWRSRNRPRLPRQDGGVGHAGASAVAHVGRAASAGPAATDTCAEEVVIPRHLGAEGLLAALLRSAERPSPDPAEGGEVWLEDYDDYSEEEVAGVR